MKKPGDKVTDILLVLFLFTCMSKNTVDQPERLLVGLAIHYTTKYQRFWIRLEIISQKSWLSTYPQCFSAENYYGFSFFIKERYKVVVVGAVDMWITCHLVRIRFSFLEPVKPCELYTYRPW